MTQRLLHVIHVIASIACDNNKPLLGSQSIATVSDEPVLSTPKQLQQVMLHLDMS